MNSSAPDDPRINWLNCLGDSLTNSDYTTLIPKDQQYPHLLQTAIDGYCRARNLGKTGDTTTQMYARLQNALYPVPTVFVIYGGINDVIQSVADATTQTNLETMIDGIVAAGCARIILCNIHTMKDATDSNYNAKRAVISAVAASKNVALCDLSEIEFVTADYWDVVHFKAAGLNKIANKIKATLDTQGWTSLLSV